uniref:NADH dehydrogenase subunit 5 n=1 Tax=Ixodes trianguliceps TaxID=347913 RepID=UPI0030FEA848
MFMKWGIFLMLKSMLMLMLFIYLVWSYKIILVEYLLFNLMSLELKVYFLFDWVSVSFMFVVLFISSMVVIYSDSYMKADNNKVYFCYMVLLFVLSMVLLILCPNMIMIILGWDGLGLVSYLLVIFYQSSNSYNSGMITVLSNRIGDVTILMSIVMLMNYGSFDLINISEILKICGIFIIISGMTKSAQLPFSAWLPAAMAAPTPVSSLVHSSTLVTAGIYLLIRFNFFFKIEFFSYMLLFFSLMTLFMAGVGANLEFDFKKIIAYSTLSQLGLIMMILSLGKVEFAFFHLLMHAIFKSMLFLCAGLVIHNLSGIQDMRYLGNFFSFSPLISSCIGLSSLSLFGFPFIGGFYSKDLILEFIYMNMNNFVLLLILILSTSLTMMYCMRMMYYIFWKGIFTQNFFSKDLSKKMIFPIYLLSLMVVMCGNMFSWVLFTFEDLIVLSNFSKLFNILLIMVTFYVFYVMFMYKMKGFYMNKIHYFLSSMWFLSMLTSFIILKYFKMMSQNSENDWKWGEEIMGPGGVNIFLVKNSIFIQWFQNNYLSSIILLVVSLIFIIMIM